MQKSALSVQEAAQVLGIHENSVYRAIWRGELRATRVGRRLLVPRGELERLGLTLEAEKNPAVTGRG